jgi:peptidoglycan/xylan/chitin deacetylase (PgdA/CDA1 family)
MTVALIYHDLAAAAEIERVGFPGPLAARYKLTPEHFEAHLDAIEATGNIVGLIGDESPGSATAITFDDGGASALDAAAALERRGWKGHFFITTERIGSAGFLEADQVLELAKRGHSVGSHSHTHPTYMGKLSRAEIDNEWRRSREILGELLQEPPATASVPGGYLSKGVIAGAAGAGYRLLFTSEPGSRPRRHDGLLVLGRYTVWSTTSPARVAGYISGSRFARGRLWLEWKAKRVAKGVMPRAYQTLRRIRARPRSGL